VNERRVICSVYNERRVICIVYIMRGECHVVEESDIVYVRTRCFGAVRGE